MVIGRERFQYVIVGFGPAGLSTLDQLLLSGVPASDIALVGMKQSVQHRDVKVNYVTDLSKDLIFKGKKLRNSGIKKQGIDTNLLDGPGESLANYWGASQLPPIWLGQHYVEFFPQQDIKNAIYATAKMMQTQAEDSTKLTEEFPICGEELGSIQRKAIAKEWVNAKESNFIHSRLSIGGHRATSDRCQNSGKCFVGCPSGAFWSPKLEFEHLTKNNPGLNVFYGEVAKIDVHRKSLFMSDSQEYFFEHLFLCAGPKNSVKILNSSKLSKEVIGFHYTPVIMQPFLVPTISMRDFQKNHVLADLLLPTIHQQKIQSLVQMYFPTENLALNILSKVPQVGLALLAFIPKRVTTLLFRKIGIAMFFLENVKYGTTRKTILKMQRRSRKDLQIQLRWMNAKLIHKIRFLAIDGASHHTGSVFLDSDTSKRGLNSEIFLDLKSKGIYLADGLALIEIPPGPHTNTVCMIARCLVVQVVRK